MSAAEGNSGPETGRNRERALLDAVVCRDRGAFADLYRLYHSRLHGYLRRILANPLLVEEVLDDVMFVVWTDARKFRGDAAVSTWIFGIAYRRAMTAIRKESRHEAAVDRGADTDLLPASLPGDSDLIRAALSELSADHRQVIELTYFCGFSYKEIAQIADCPVNTVKTRMFHARRRLRYLLPLLGNPVKEQNSDQC